MKVAVDTLGVAGSGLVEQLGGMSRHRSRCRQQAEEEVLGTCTVHRGPAHPRLPPTTALPSPSSGHQQGQ